MVAAKKSDEKFGHNLARDFGDSNQSCTVSAGALTETGCALPTSLKCRVCFFNMKYNLKMFANHQEMSHHLTLFRQNCTWNFNILTFKWCQMRLLWWLSNTVTMSLECFKCWKTMMSDTCLISWWHLSPLEFVPEDSNQHIPTRKSLTKICIKKDDKFQGFFVPWFGSFLFFVLSFPSDQSWERDFSI